MILKTFGMAQDTASMLAEAAIFAALSFTVSVSTLRARAALITVWIKFLLPVAYFLAFLGPYWLQIDDQTYFHNQSRFFAAGYTLSTLTWPKLIFLMAETGHLWNVVGIAMYSLFGPGYSTNIYLDVFATFLCVPYIMRALTAAEVKPATARAYCIFFLLNFEMLAQSSLFDMRDTLIMAFSTIAIAGFISLLRRKSLFDLISVVAGLALLFLLRPYATVLLILTFSTAPLWTLQVTPKTYGRFKLLLAMAGATGLAALAFVVLHYRAQLGYLKPPNPHAMLKFLISPLMWHLGKPYYGWARPFAVFDNLTMPFMALGAYLMWRDYKRLRILLAILAAYMLLYGMISSITEDYRLRYQIIVTYSLMQFFGLRALFYFARYGTAAWPPAWQADLRRLMTAFAALRRRFFAVAPLWLSRPRSVPDDARTAD